MLTTINQAVQDLENQTLTLWRRSQPPLAAPRVALAFFVPIRREAPSSCFPFQKERTMSRKTNRGLPPQTPSSTMAKPYAHFEYLRDVQIARLTLAHDKRALDLRLAELVRKRSAAVEYGWLRGEPGQTSA